MISEKDIEFIGNISLEDLDIFQKNKVEWLTNSNYNLETKRSYFSSLENKVHELEKALNKDLYQFTQVEIENTIKGVSSFSIQTPIILFSIINSYIQWTVETGMNLKGENPCNKIIIKDVININSNALKELYTSREEFYSYIMSLEGSIIDKTVIMLLRYGVRLIDVPFLKYDDVDENNMKLIINNEEGILKIPIDELLISCIKECKDTDEYEKLSEKKNFIMKYLDFGYIIKQTEKGYNRSKEEIVNHRTLHTRIKKLFDDNGLQKINVNSLRNMAMFDMLLDEYERKGKLYYSDSKRVVLTYSNLRKNNLEVKTFRIRQLFESISDIKFIKD